MYASIRVIKPKYEAKAKLGMVVYSLHLGPKKSNLLVISCGIVYTLEPERE